MADLPAKIIVGEPQPCYITLDDVIKNTAPEPTQDILNIPELNHQPIKTPTYEDIQTELINIVLN